MMLFKRKTVLLLAAIGVLAFALTGCGTKPNAKSDTAAKPKAVNFTSLPSQRAADLLEAAKKEGEVRVYTVTGRVQAAASGFEKKYGIRVQVTSLKDYELIDRVSLEVKGKTPGADMVICQDSSRVYAELLAPGFLQSYMPEDLKSSVDPDRQNPLVFDYMNKIFVYNNEKGEKPALTNIWQLTDPELKGRFMLKNPVHEGINANFLVMLTKPQVAKALEKAYEAHYNKKLVLTAPNAGYEWIKRAFANGIVIGSSDTAIMEKIGAKGQDQSLYGLINYSKLRQAGEKNLAIAPIEKMEPFCGYVYPQFMLMVKDAQHPAAAKLFMEYLLTAEGFEPWAESKGSYSSNSRVAPAKGDKSFEEWQRLMVEGEPRYIYEHRKEVMEFISRNM